MRTTALLCLYVCVTAPLAAQREPIPSARATHAARSSLSRELVEVLAASAGRKAAVESLVARSRVQELSFRPAMRFALLQIAIDVAVKAGDLELARVPLEERLEGFVGDRFAVTAQVLERIAAVRTNRRALAFAWLDLAALAARDTQRIRGGRRLTQSLAKARGMAAAVHDTAIQQWIRYGLQAELEERHAVWVGLDDPAAARGRLLCFVEGDWRAGIPLLTPANATERNALARKRGADLDGTALVTVAESWLSAAKSFPADSKTLRRLVDRNTARYARSFYGRAWCKLDGAERLRVERALSRLEDKCFDVVGPGFARIGLHGRQQVVVDGTKPVLRDGKLWLQSDGGAARATVRYAYEKIRAVKIRAGIASANNQNLRIAVGSFNAICNWELRAENHFRIGTRRWVTKPPLIQANKTHEIRIRQLGDAIAFFVDGKLEFHAPGKLAGTVCVYAAAKSEVFVEQILVDGDLDASIEVTGPIGKTW